MKYGIIYKATNKINGKIYIGKTIKKLKEREKEHIYNSQKTDDYGDYVFFGKFYNSIRKYGYENFVFEELYSEVPENLLISMEIYCIEIYNSFYNGLNSTIGGEGISGWHPTEEQRIRSSERMKNFYIQNPNVVKENIQRLTKYWQHPDNIDRLSLKAVEQFKDPLIRNQLSDKRKEYYKSHPEALQQLKVKLKNFYANPLNIKKASDAQRASFSNPVRITNNKRGRNKATITRIIEAKK